MQEGIRHAIRRLNKDYRAKRYIEPRKVVQSPRPIRAAGRIMYLAKQIIYRLLPRKGWRKLASRLLSQKYRYPPKAITFVRAARRADAR